MSYKLKYRLRSENIGNIKYSCGFPDVALKKIRAKMEELKIKQLYQNLEKIGLSGQGYSVHKLRHTAATLMYQYGNVDIRVLKDILGHENLGTTQIYTHIENTELKIAAEANPLSKLDFSEENNE